MSVAQEVLNRLLTDSGFCRRVQAEGEVALGAYNLSESERKVILRLNLAEWSDERYNADPNDPSTIGISRAR